MELGWRAGFAGPEAKRDAGFTPLPCPKQLTNQFLLQRRAITLPEAKPNNKGLNTPLQIREKVEGLSGRACACSSICYVLVVGELVPQSAFPVDGKARTGMTHPISSGCPARLR